MESGSFAEHLTSVDSWLAAQLRRLENMAVRLSSERDLSANLREIVRAMAEALGTRMNSIQLLDEQAGDLVNAAAVGLPEQFVRAVHRIPVAPAAGACGSAAYWGVYSAIEDTRTDPRCAAYREIAEEADVRAVWSVPIVTPASGKVLGTFATYYHEPYKPQPQEIELAQAYARHAAVAIENSRLYEASVRSEARYRSLMQHASDGIFIFDANGNWLEANSAATEMLGYAADEVTTLTSATVIPAEDLAREPIPFDRLRAGQTVRDERRFLRKDESIIHVEVTANRVGDDTFVAIIRDITQRHHSERVQKAIYELASALVRAEALEQIYEEALNGLQAALGVKRASISLFDEGGAIRFKAWRGLSDDYRKRVEARPTAPVGDLDQVTLISDVTTSESTKPFEEALAREQIRSIGLIPLIYEGRALGRLVLYYCRPHEFRDEERQVAQTIASHVALAIERRRTEQAIAGSEHEYRGLFESARDAILIVEPDDEIVLDVNQRACDLYGFSRAEFVGRSLISLTRQTEQPGQSAKMTAEERFETVHVTSDGRELSLEVNASFVDYKGKRAILSINRDVTERKRAEQERNKLLESERLARARAEGAGQLSAQLLAREQAVRAEAEEAHREWQTTLDTMADSVVVVGTDDRLIRANKSFYRSIRLAPEECVGRQLRELFHPPEGKYPYPANCPACQLRAKGEQGAIEVPAGVVSDSPFFASVDPILNANGERIGVIQTIRNLSALYQAREEAERERISLNATIEQMADGLLVLNQLGSVIRANRNAERLLGFKVNELIGDRESRLAVGRFTDEEGSLVSLTEQPVNRALRDRTTVNARLWYLRPDSVRRLLSIAASPFYDDKGKLVGAIALLRDVTEQQRERERALQADKLRALGQLASGVAHNLNNALAAVLGYTQLALPKTNNADVGRYLRVVEKSAKDAARMVERIQNFSRARSAKDEFISLRILDVVRDAMDITKPRWRSDAESRGIKYEVKLNASPGDDILVNGEPSELREVFVNIIFNALDAMPLGGRLSVDTSTGGGETTLSFADSGAGMTEEIKQRIFEPFFSTKGAAGLGMGLSESYRIIERHGGRLDVESQAGAGTTFYIRLPLVGLVEANADAEFIESVPGCARVLVIDDEEPVRTLLSTMLVTSGHGVATVESAEEGLALIEDVAFDVVFTDLAMPATDGISAALRIKARSPRTRVVLMTGYGVEKVRELAAEGGAVDFAISKPFTMADVQKALLAVLGRRPTPSESGRQQP